MATSTAMAGMCTRVMRNFRGFRPALVSINQQQRMSWRCMSTTNENPQTEGAAKPENTEENVTGNEDALKLAELEKSFALEKAELLKQVSDFKDKYTRSLAEAENVRQRMQKQVTDAKLFGTQGFCKDLLEVADILSTATTSVPKEAISDDNPHLKSLFEGLTMTESQLQKVFVKNGLNLINPAEGEKFDPHRHEALFQQFVEGKESDTVAIVTKVGYNLHDRTIRPALVGVFK